VRKRISILLILTLSAIMAYGVIGSGAEFVYNGSASQTFTVGSLEITLNSSTPGATVNGNTVTCPAILITESSSPWTGGPVCNITATSTGSIGALNFSVFMSAATNGAHLDRFAVTATGLLGSTPKVLSNVSAPMGVATSFPVSVDLETSWGYAAAAGSGIALDNNDMGKTVVVSYTLTVAQ
jgi:hypothetical protein